MQAIGDITELTADGPVFLYGTGRGGEIVLEALRQRRPDIVVAGVFDSHRRGTFQGMVIVAPQDAPDLVPANGRILIASQHVYDIMQRLRELGLESRTLNAYPLVARTLKAEASKPSVPMPAEADVDCAARLRQLEGEVDALYRLFYRVLHNLDRTPDLAAIQTRQAFDSQWTNLPEGAALLSEPWFRQNVARIVAEEELQIDPAWLRGKRVLDCGCGNGRWAYGLASLGAKVTAVDASPSGLEATRRVLTELGAEAEYILSPLEALDEALPPERRFDLVWCWGVLHHCGSFTGALRNVLGRVAAGGFAYFYLYSQDAMPHDKEMGVFKKRVFYNAMETESERAAFLLAEANNDPVKIHGVHDAFAPLVNRRLNLPIMEKLTAENGFSVVQRLKTACPDLFLRVLRKPDPALAAAFLPPLEPPYWFERYSV